MTHRLTEEELRALVGQEHADRLSASIRSATRVAPPLSRIPKAHWRNRWQVVRPFSIVSMETGLLLDEGEYLAPTPYISAEQAEQAAIDNIRKHPAVKDAVLYLGWKKCEGAP